MKNITVLTAIFVFLIGISSLFPLILLPGRGVSGTYLFCCISDITFKSLFILIFVSIFLVAIGLRHTFKNSLTFALSFALFGMSLMMNDLIQEFEGAFVKQVIYENIGSSETIILYTGLLFGVASLFFILGLIQLRKTVVIDAVTVNEKIKQNNLKQQINHKLKMVICQYKLGGTTNIYIPILQELQQEFFSDDLLLQQKGLKGLENLLLTRRVWGVLGEYLEGDAYKDKFIDNFNNFVAWECFLDGLVADAVRYHGWRVKREGLYDA